MVRSILKSLLFIAALLSITSCERLVESGTIIAGNQKYRSGEYQEAIIDYLKGVNSESNRDYFYYNLGNVYTSLGEYPAAFSIWSRTDGGVNSQLKYNLLYNRGFLEFKLGNYKDAYNLFQQALIIMPSSINAKINLEITLNKMSAASYNQNPEKSDKNLGVKGTSDETQRILEYVRQKEAMSWGINHQGQELENDW